MHYASVLYSLGLDLVTAKVISADAAPTTDLVGRSGEGSTGISHFAAHHAPQYLLRVQ